MQMTKRGNINFSERLLLNTEELQTLLGCGRMTAVKIGNEAKAKVTIGRRVLWNRGKVENFINCITD